MKSVTSAQVVQGVGEVDSGGRSGEWPDGSLGMSYQGSGSGDGGLGPWKSRRTTSTDLSLPLLFSRFPMVLVHRTWAT